MGTDNERNNPNQSQSQSQGQTQSQRPAPDDLNKRPQENHEVGKLAIDLTDRDPARDRSGYGRSGVNDKDSGPEDGMGSEPVDPVERERLEQLKRQQRDQEG